MGTRRPLERPETLAARVANVLRQDLRNNPVASGQLPSEPELAEQFGVSRGTVRQALTILEREGVILRRQGAGTYVHKYISRIQTRAEHAYEFADLLRLAGYEPSIQLISFEIKPTVAGISAQLDIEPDAQVLIVRKLFLADDHPAIYCQDYIPQHLVIEPYEDDELKQTIFDFMAQRCHQQSIQNMAEIIPEVATEELSKLLDIEHGKPLLRTDEVGYNEAGNPVIFTRSFFKDKYLRFSLLRKRI
ncbi:MAG: GntR family transcriptional regulator [Chloroflexi bacterium]|nr:GntR family transcriptional regulator [Chloroflexota bacterium]